MKIRKICSNLIGGIPLFSSEVSLYAEYSFFQFQTGIDLKESMNYKDIILNSNQEYYFTDTYESKIVGVKVDMEEDATAVLGFSYSIMELPFLSPNKNTIFNTESERLGIMGRLDFEKQEISPTINVKEFGNKIGMGAVFFDDESENKLIEENIIKLVETEDGNQSIEIPIYCESGYHTDFSLMKRSYLNIESEIRTITADNNLLSGGALFLTSALQMMGTTYFTVNHSDSLWIPIAAIFIQPALSYGTAELIGDEIIQKEAVFSVGFSYRF